MASDEAKNIFRFIRENKDLHKLLDKYIASAESEDLDAFVAATQQKGEQHGYNFTKGHILAVVLFMGMGRASLENL